MFFHFTRASHPTLGVLLLEDEDNNESNLRLIRHIRHSFYEEHGVTTESLAYISTA